jgi:hypothetical protein
MAWKLHSPLDLLFATFVSAAIPLARGSIGMPCLRQMLFFPGSARSKFSIWRAASRRKTKRIPRSFVHIGMKYRIYLVVVGAAVVVAILLRPRTEPAAPNPDPAPTPAGHPEAERPARRMAAHSALPQAPPEESTSTNLFDRLIKGDGVHLTPEQIDAFLAANHRSAESLLAASRACDNPAYLKEAKEKFPGDPRVQYAAIFKSDSPEERRQWLDRLKQTAPDNALPAYLSALDDLKAGRTQQGVQELTDAVGKAAFQDYSLDFIQIAEEAYRSAGYSDVESKLIAMTELLLPQLAQLKQLGGQIGELASSYRQAGDTASEQAVLQMALHLGQQLDVGANGGKFLINNLVGIAIQLNALKMMDPASPYGNPGQTVQDYMDQITQHKAALRRFAQQNENLLPNMPPEDLISFLDREKLYGEPAALQWYLNKIGQPSGAGSN